MNLHLFLQRILLPVAEEGTFSLGTIYSPEKIFVILTNRLSTLSFQVEQMEEKHKIYLWFSSLVQLRSELLSLGESVDTGNIFIS